MPHWIIASLVCAAILPPAQTDNAVRQFIQKQFEAAAAYRGGDIPRAFTLLATTSIAEQRKAVEAILEQQGNAAEGMPLQSGDIPWTGRQLRALAALHMPAFARIVANFKSRYQFTYAPTNVPPGGWHELEVRLKTRRGAVTARRGYYR